MAHNNVEYVYMPNVGNLQVPAGQTYHLPPVSLRGYRSSRRSNYRKIVDHKLSMGIPDDNHLYGECSVRYGAGRGGFSLARPRPYTGPGGGIFRVIPAPPPPRAQPHSFPGRGPVCYHQFLTGTRPGYGWGGGLSGDRGRECRKRHPAPCR